MTEYAATFGLRTVIDRCGVIAGPWQMGKVDQGVFTHWVLSHYFGRELSYIGYGGRGKQVRDLLHVDDLVDLVEDQLASPGPLGRRDRERRRRADVSLSLLETTRSVPRADRQLGRGRELGRHAPGRRPHLPVRLRAAGAATPTGARARSPREVLEDIFGWVADERARRARARLARRWRIAIVTGSGGLIGSESVAHFVKAGFDVIGLENDMRARFFGPDASTRPVTERLVASYPEFRSLDVDIRDTDAVERVFAEHGAQIELVVHTAAQPSHDWAASEPPRTSA